MRIIQDNKLYPLHLYEILVNCFLFNFSRDNSNYLVSVLDYGFVQIMLVGQVKEQVVLDEELPHFICSDEESLISGLLCAGLYPLWCRLDFSGLWLISYLG
jgi:hypothetical protein